MNYTGDMILRLATDRCAVHRWQVSILGIIPMIGPELNKVAKKAGVPHLIPAGSFLAAVYPCLKSGKLENIQKEDFRKGRDAVIDSVPCLRECLVGKVQTLHDRISGKYVADSVKMSPMDKKCDLEDGFEGGECLHNVDGVCKPTSACAINKREKGHCAGGKELICCLNGSPLSSSLESKNGNDDGELTAAAAAEGGDKDIKSGDPSDDDDDDDDTSNEDDDSDAFLEVKEDAPEYSSRQNKYHTVDKVSLIDDAHTAVFELLDNTISDMVQLDGSNSRYEHGVNLLTYMSENFKKHY